jgi:hypothetical protein
VEISEILGYHYGGGTPGLSETLRDARLLSSWIFPRVSYFYLSVCVSVGECAPSLRSLGHVVVLLLVTNEVPDIAGNEDVRGKT